MKTFVCQNCIGDGCPNCRKANERKLPMKTWNVFWAPEGRKIATVQARTPKAARHKAPKPYRKYLGEIYVEEVQS